MSTEDRSTKRRRADDAADEVPSAVLSASISPDRHDEAQVQLTAPELDEIPELIVQIASNDKDDVAAALADLSNLVSQGCPDFQANKATAASLGALSLTILAMKKWQHKESVHLRGCHCLLLFAFTVDEAKNLKPNEKLTILMAQMGGIEAILDAVKLHSDSAIVVKYGIWALRNIFGCIGVLTKYADRFLNQIGGVSAIIEAMKNHLDDTTVQENACACLMNLAWKKELRGALLKSGTMSAISASLEAHPDDKDIKSVAAAFTKRVFSDS